ncbi:P-loop containing nucleoside triphosphate hydrolase protein [Cristinia sonorae]|uniref:P-loop containing nucleoside triphosphate hydrolase protein n=1 Tax=Cristinia sonorae TaxID=1940300 RepID=A0A8K0XS78_9AGAR|nr:P-loop containing nucleoside triphosphate hydrolase protein [Cristinia sonorae]
MSTSGECTGLGKTLLMIALISEQILRFGRRGTNLVVCPGIGLMYQWRNELNKFAPGLKVLLYRDSDIPSGIKSVDEKFMAQYDVVIVLYCQVRSQHSCKIRWEKEEIFVSEKNRWPLFKLVWHRVILDEAHTIRNSQCKTTLACFAVSKRFGYCLTATPIHNSVLDLFPLVCFINATYKGLTDEKVFREKICLPLRHHTTVIPRVLDELLADCLIYRSYYRPNGEPLIEMPHRFEHRYEVVLSTKEFIFYCFMHEKWYFNSVLARMTREQQGAVCPMLATRALAAEENGDDDTEEAAPVDGIPSPSPKRSPKKYANKHISEGDVAVDLNNLPEELRGLAEIFGSTYLSSKMWKSVDIYFRIQHDRPGDKVIIISRFRDTLEVLASYFRNVGIQSIYYRGDMSAQQRTEALRQLAEDDSCMICFMTVQSGGVGLNITSCNNVILLEPWWNPYIEEQAFGRVHRIGQKKDCHIYRLYALGTIDEQILETQEKKYKLVKGIFSAFEGPTDEDREEWMKGVSASLDIIRRTSSYSSGDAVI